MDGELDAIGVAGKEPSILVSEVSIFGGLENIEDFDLITGVQVEAGIRLNRVGGPSRVGAIGEPVMDRSPKKLALLNNGEGAGLELSNFGESESH
jgi:hypothetical protein